MPVSRNLKIIDAQNIQRQTNHDIIIVLAVNPASGQLEYASYGKDEGMCARGKTLADEAFNCISNMIEGKR